MKSYDEIELLRLLIVISVDHLAGDLAEHLSLQRCHRLLDEGENEVEARDSQLVSVQLHERTLVHSSASVRRFSQLEDSNERLPVFDRSSLRISLFSPLFLSLRTEVMARS